MTEKEEKKSSELTVSTAGVTIKGELADSLGKPVKRLAGTADSVLRLFDNLVSLPLDYFSHNLEGFRRKFAEKFEEIPVDARVEPPMRIGYAVLQQVSHSADEPDIQELFAQLLASASNAETVAKVHPGFATVISELHATDARVLRFIAETTRRGHWQVPSELWRNSGIDTGLVNRSISNLLRLGLIEWQDTPYTPTELNRFVGKRYYNAPRRPEDLDRLFVEAVNDLQHLKNELIKQLSTQHSKRALFVSTFGQHFIQVALAPTRING